MGACCAARTSDVERTRRRGAGDARFCLRRPRGAGWGGRRRRRLTSVWWLRTVIWRGICRCGVRSAGALTYGGAPDAECSADRGCGRRTPSCKTRRLRGATAGGGCAHGACAPSRRPPPCAVDELPTLRCWTGRWCFGSSGASCRRVGGTRTTCASGSSTTGCWRRWTGYARLACGG